MTVERIIILALIVVFGVLLAVVYFSGEHRAQAVQAVAAQQAKDAVVEQKRIDDANANTVITDLQQQLAVATKLATRPAPVVRLCPAAGSVRANPAGSAPRPDSRGPATPARSLPEMPGSTGAGTDVGPGLQRLIAASEAVGAYARACREWGVLQGKP